MGRGCLVVVCSCRGLKILFLARVIIGCVETDGGKGGDGEEGAGGSEGGFSSVEAASHRGDGLHECMTECGVVGEGMVGSKTGWVDEGTFEEDGMDCVGDND